jgi:hypothetical protein
MTAIFVHDLVEAPDSQQARLLVWATCVRNRSMRTLSKPTRFAGVKVSWHCL